MIIQQKTIDHKSPLAKKQFKQVVSKWRTECMESVVGRKTLKGKRRTLLRQIKRRRCHIDKQEHDDHMVISFMDKGVVRGRLTVTFKNYKPESATT